VVFAEVLQYWYLHVVVLQVSYSWLEIDSVDPSQPVTFVVVAIVVLTVSPLSRDPVPPVICPYDP